MRNKNKFTYIELLMNPILSKPRFKAIATLMRRRNCSYEQALKIQSNAIIREQNNVQPKEKTIQAKNPQ